MRRTLLVILLLALIAGVCACILSGTIQQVLFGCDPRTIHPDAITSIVFGNYVSDQRFVCTDADALQYFGTMLRDLDGPPTNEEGERSAAQKEFQRFSKAYECCIHLKDGDVCCGYSWVMLEPVEIMFKPNDSLSNPDPPAMYAEGGPDPPESLVDFLERLSFDE